MLKTNKIIKSLVLVWFLINLAMFPIAASSGLNEEHAVDNKIIKNENVNEGVFGKISAISNRIDQGYKELFISNNKKINDEMLINPLSQHYVILLTVLLYSFLLFVMLTIAKNHNPALNRLRNSRKAAFTIQMSWIFILIAGATVTLFFVLIVQKQTFLSEQKRNLDVRTGFKTILVAAKQSTGTVFAIDAPKGDISFSCQGYGIGELSPIKLGESFSPGTIRSVTGSIYIWVIDWSLPFKAANFIYVTSPDVKYVIVNDTGGNLAEELYDSLPDEITKVMVDDAGEVNDTNNYNVKMIFFEENDVSFPESLRDLNDDAVSAILISAEEGLDGYGNVSFYKKDDGGFIQDELLYYLKLPSLLGAVFVDSAESYECMMNSSFKRLNMVARIYANRTAGFYGQIDGGDLESCSSMGPRYDIANDTINEIKTYAEGYDYSNVAEIYGRIGAVRNDNRILQLNSCPLIY